MAVKTKIKKAIKEIIICYRKSFFLKNKENVHNLSKAQLRRAKSLGFTPEEYAIYNLDVNNPQEYISEFERLLYRDAVRDNRVILDNKLVFYNIIRNFANVNKVYAYSNEEHYVVLECGYEKENILERLKEKERIVYKKNASGGGAGFKLLGYKDGQYYINRIKCAKEDIVSLLEDDDYLLEEYCVQSDFENELYPHSVNTLRLITFEENGKYKVQFALQRMGATPESVVDNACMGGLYAVINVESGIMSAARSHGVGMLTNDKGEMLEFNNHPVTGCEIRSRRIPNWEFVVSSVEQLHEKIRFTGIDFIAWDIALTEEGIKIIEANTSCSMDFIQSFGGVRNEKFGCWMKGRGYIS